MRVFQQEVAERTRLRLFAEGFRGHRLDVACRGTIRVESSRSRRGVARTNLVAHFATLIPDDGDVPILIKIIKALRDGKVAVIVLPRDTADVVRARVDLASQRPEFHVGDWSAMERPGGSLGEHAAVNAVSGSARRQKRA